MSPQRVALLTLAATSSSSSPSAFAFAFGPPQSTLHRPLTTQIHASQASEYNPHHAELTEDQATTLLTSANLCANSPDSLCSIESAELYLKEIIHIQSGCAAGTLAGEFVCEDVGFVSEVVGGLREKIRGGKRAVSAKVEESSESFWNQRQEEFQTLALASGTSPVAAWQNAPLKPAYLAMAALYAVLLINFFSFAFPDGGMSSSALGGVVPFTFQEIWWSIRDGYFADLAAHLMKNGGLVVGDIGDLPSLTAVQTLSSLTPQEVWWSIRDGYFADTLFANKEVLVTRDVTSAVPVRPQEVWWAVRDGYVGDLMEHLWRNGGLSM